MTEFGQYKKYLEQIKAQDHVVISVTRMMEALGKCEKYHEMQYTQFNDPESVQVGLSVIGNREVSLRSFGGYEDAEYEVVGFFPPFSDASEEAFPISLVQLDYAKQFGAIEHKDVLGTLISIGIERKMFGDILIHDGFVQMFVLKTMVPVLKTQLTKIRNHGVTVNEIPLAEFVEPVLEKKVMTFSVASLRLDAIISGAFNMSRAKAIGLIKAGRVKCNYSICEKTDIQMQSGDMISVRRFGRFYVNEVLGISKKGKLRLSGERIAR
ncbi:MULTISPECIES: RNA-binding protein [unclassified Fusibacter]|uniref:YlmH family RNA-binding protein n=1 Tax=unclassified Fusibacter TaxID=2624464 RepID=UPI001012A037|nr:MULTISPECIES: YlmH/Sll1252 family protein [unclassified Fusibacter]MCK8058029.1 YlmH/Sll1252 family protein [Fusibacter sp. A2]NPE20611.1 hypothetical protein [Fusibacter sp. A1]RXV62818.1 hypothetical protein DWB64_02170 [Fusibacter sp. A1]